MASHLSKELKVRWARTDLAVNDWGYENAALGWKHAYEMYKGRDPKWYFEDIMIDINNDREGIAVFWVTFDVDGKSNNKKMLFIETFRKEKDEWKKIREYVENSFGVDVSAKSL